MSVSSVQKRDEAPLAQTLLRAVSLVGVGLHTGRDVRLTLRPAPAGTGILFRRMDLLENDGPSAQEEELARITIAAAPEAVCATTLGTVLKNRFDVRIATVEHLMSAFAGLGVHHVIVEVEGPEVPIMDGSAQPFVDLIEAAGLRALGAPAMAFELTEPVRLEMGDSAIEATPLLPGMAPAMRLDITIDFADRAIGRQRLILSDAMSLFGGDVAAARTFCRLSDVEAMRAQGLALGGSLDNAIVVDGEAILNEGGFRIDREFVRHKALDLIGDVYLLGAPLLANIRAVRPGHDINTNFARILVERGVLSARRQPARTDGAEVRLGVAR